MNLSEEIDSDRPTNRVWLAATDVSDEPNSVHSDWDGGSLSVGDKIEIEVLPDGPSDPPTTVIRTSESPNNLFSDVQQARSLLTAITICDKALMGVLNGARDVEPEHELHKIRTAIGAVLAEIDQQLISPTLRRHPALLAHAEEMKLR